MPKQYKPRANSLPSKLLAMEKGEQIIVNRSSASVCGDISRLHTKTNGGRWEASSVWIVYSNSKRNPQSRVIITRTTKPTNSKKKDTTCKN